MNHPKPMQNSFNHRVNAAWSESGWMIEEMFSGGMCFFEGYIPAIDLEIIGSALRQLSDTGIDCTSSIWSNGTTEIDWNRTYPLAEYVSFFRNEWIHMLHADYTVVFSEYSFTLKLIFESDANLEVIFYRENLLPRSETRDRFIAACNYMRHLQSLFRGAALFIGPDTLNYPAWPDSVPKEWQRLL